MSEIGKEVKEWVDLELTFHNLTYKHTNKQKNHIYKLKEKA